MMRSSGRTRMGTEAVEEHVEGDVQRGNEGAGRREARRGLGSATLRWLRRILLTGLSLSLLAIAAGLGTYLYFARGLPSIDALKNHRPWQTTRIVAADGALMKELAEQRRTPVRLSQMPRRLVLAILAAEDAEFYSHSGWDYPGIARAAWKNLWSKGRRRQGASTITQQVVRTFLLTRRQTYRRKIREMLLARRLEKGLSKDRILELYLNQIYFGRGRYGVKEAVRYYFRKELSLVTLSEAAIIAGIPKNPEVYNPASSPARTRFRRNLILGQMLSKGFISRGEYQAARKEAVLRPPRWVLPTFARSYYTEQVRRESVVLLERYLEPRVGDPKRRRRMAFAMLYRGGLRIETALEQRLQLAAKQALDRGIRALERRRPYRGPYKRLGAEGVRAARRRLKASQLGPYPRGGRLRGVVLGRLDRSYLVDLGWRTGVLDRGSAGWAGTWKPGRTEGRGAREPGLAAGDLIRVRVTGRRGRRHLLALDQAPVAQGALVAVDPVSRRIVAMVGGTSYLKSRFNRAVQALRQPGSAFKVILYAAAIESRLYTAASLVNDAFIAIPAGLTTWIPNNAGRRYSNRQMTLRDALAGSVNTVAVRVQARIGTARVIELARRLGIRSRLTRRLPLALGASGVRLIDLTNAFASLAAEGMHAEPALVTRITDPDGRVIYERLPNPRRALSRGTAFIMTSMLQDVVRRGTGRSVQALGRPVAGKTGTSNDARDAWFVGYTPQLCAGVWVGFDDRRPMGRGEGGGRTAAPIFAWFMAQAHTDSRGRQIPARSFRVPEELEFARIDQRTGALASSGGGLQIREAFLPGTRPSLYAQLGAQGGPDRALREDL